MLEHIHCGGLGYPGPTQNRYERPIIPSMKSRSTPPLPKVPVHSLSLNQLQDDDMAFRPDAQKGDLTCQLSFSGGLVTYDLPMKR